MRKRYCVNIDYCIVLPMALPIAWSIFFLGLFVVTFFISLAKGELAGFPEAIVNNGYIWFYISCPILLAVSALVSAAFVLFPISYVEVGDESVRVHRPFKRDRIVQYEEMFYVRLAIRRKTLWALAFILALEANEINTIEIRKAYPLPSLWLSSSRKAYVAIAEQFERACAGKKDLIKGEFHVAESKWVAQYGNPDEVDWGGHNGNC